MCNLNIPECGRQDILLTTLRAPAAEKLGRITTDTKRSRAEYFLKYLRASVFVVVGSLYTLKELVVNMMKDYILHSIPGPMTMKRQKFEPVPLVCFWTQR